MGGLDEAIWANPQRRSALAGELLAKLGGCPGASGDPAQLVEQQLQMLAGVASQKGLVLSWRRDGSRLVWDLELSASRVQVRGKLAIKVGASGLVPVGVPEEGTPTDTNPIGLREDFCDAFMVSLMSAIAAALRSPTVAVA